MSSNSDSPPNSSHFTLPTGLQIAREKLSRMELRPAGFQRKIVEVFPNLILAWAGVAEEAKALAKDIQFYFIYIDLTKEHLDDFVTANESNFPNVQGMVLASLGSRGWVFRLNIPKNHVAESPVFNRFMVAGSGTTQFLHALRNPVVPILDGEFEEDPISQVLDFIASS
jgi:hypothetical protein